MHKARKHFFELAQRAEMLERSIDSSLNKQQLLKIAQEAADSYHELVLRLQKNEKKEKDYLIRLSLKYNQIENNAITKMSGNKSL
jgi:hypothetical protein